MSRSAIGLRILGLALLAAGWASPVQALPYSGTLTVQYTVPAVPEFDGVPLLTVSGGGTSSDGPGGAFTLNAGDFTGTDFVFGGPLVLPTVAALDLSVASGAGSFGTAGGSMSVGGTMTQYFFGFEPGFGVPLPLATVGAGGTDSFNAPVGGGFLSGTIAGSEWTTGTVSVPGVQGPLVASGLDARAADGTGTIVLVTGFQVTFNEIPAITEPIPGVATLTLHFVPEPGTISLIAFGTAAIAAARARGI